MNLTEMVLDHPFRQYLRIFFDLWVFDLEIYFVIFISVAYS